MAIEGDKRLLHIYKYPQSPSQTVNSSPAQAITSQNEERERDRERDLNLERASKYGTICWHLSLVILICTMVLALLWTVYLSVDYYSCTTEQRFAQMRQDFVVKERRRRLGGSLGLTPLEEVANQRLLAIKRVDEEMHQIWSDYQPRPHFLAKYQINETDLYSALRSMPKGGLLHVHDAGMFKTELLIELTNYADLWACVDIDGSFEDFRFSSAIPQIKPQGDYKCQWMLMSNFHMQDSTSYRDKLRATLSMDAHSYTNATHLANHLKRAHRLIHGLITYRPMWPTFLFSMLEDFYADGVTYVELRSSLPIMYDLSGTNYTIWDTANSLITITNIFRSTHDDFIGIKLIYAPVRDYNDSSMQDYLQIARFLKAKFPKFFIGFDLISFGDECQFQPLGSAIQLLHISKEIDFYFHAGESRCQNTTTNLPDANLIDALLLGSKRLGNPLNLPLHPEMLRVMKLLKIAAEVCPLSNHYMQYVNDFSQHPAAYLISAGYPIVVGSDYPYFWNAAPLTDDFYVAFVGIANGQANLRLLKQLAMNSFLYSALTEEEKHNALSKWHNNWDHWVDNFVRRT
ncbi:adenosine deaminase 2 [Drosophila grimshawi]|uniref:adenosine deaminase 2 n=1 Tax=Drosophila grimshawi TaxID=7222 RepID=UPI001C935C04|nr:adenosine deaminase 2 [Drosophila grimshawi]